MQKILKASIYFLAAAITVTAGSGCLKDSLADDQMTFPDIKSSPSVVELMGAREPVSQMISFAVSLISSDKDTTLNLQPVRLAADQPAPEDIQVELELVPALLNTYNTATGAHLIAPAASLYKFPNGLTVTIPKGSREGPLNITTKPSALVGPEYGLALRIKSVSNPKYLISGNHNSSVIIIGVRNKYDGVYSLRVKTTGWAAYSISDNVPMTYPEDISMITSSATAVALYNPLFGTGFVPAFTSAGDPTGFGAATPIFTFDPATDRLVSVINSSADDGRGRAFELIPTVTNSRFDPATKTIYAAYYLKQNGRPNMSIYDTLTFVGPRP